MAVSVNVGAQPLERECEIPFGNSFEIVRVGFFYGGSKLSCVKATQRIGGEITEISHGPVNILQNAHGVGWRGETQVGFDFFVPGGGQVVHRKIAIYEGAFEFKPQKDMKVIAYFVGLDSDEMGLDEIGALSQFQGRIAGEPGGGCRRAGYGDIKTPRKGGYFRCDFPRIGTEIRGC